MALRSSITVAIALCALGAPLAASAQAQPAAESVGPAPTLVLPRVQPPPMIAPGARATAPSPLILSDPSVLRLRLKGFVTDIYAPALPGRQLAGDAPPLSEALAQIDALSPEELRALEARLSPIIGISRGLAPAVAGQRRAAAAVPAQQGEAEALRQELDRYFARMEPYAPMAGQNAAVFSRLMTSSRQSVAALSEQELLSMLDLYASVPSMRVILSTDPATLFGPPPASGGSQAALGLDSAGPQKLLAGSIHTNSNCADMTFGPLVTAIARAAANTGDDVADLLSDDYMAGNFNIKEIPQLIAKGIAMGLELLAIAMEADTKYFSDCNDSAHQTLMVQFDAEMRNRMGAIDSMLDDPTKPSDIKRILDNRMDRIDTFNAEFRKLALRLGIEQDLVRHGDPRIAMFQVPNDICITVGEHKNCGQLDTVRAIVDDTIFDNRAAGFDTTLATEVFQDGDNQRALGRYKAAYTRYRYAYQLAVRSN